MRLRGGFSYILAVTKLSLVSCVCFGALLRITVLRGTPALPSLGNRLLTIATKLRTPFARFAAASPSDFSERLPAPAARFLEIVSGSMNQFPPLFLPELLANSSP